MNTERELTGYCGLYCGDCIRYRSRSADLARDLLNELQDTKFNKYAKAKSSSMDNAERFKYYHECCEVLAAIVELQCNKPCRVRGGSSTFSCKIVECCKKKGLEGCWQCAEFENCGEFESLYSFHGDTPKRNIKIIKEKGIDGWSRFRGKFYVWR